MPSENRTKAPLDAVEAFLAHMRHHPEDAGQSSARLSERFGLPIPFVREVLSYARRPDHADPSWRINVSLDGFRAAVDQAEAIFDRVTSRTATFIVASTAIVTLVFVLVLIATAQFGSSLNGDFAFAYRGFGAVLFLGAFSTHMLVFLRNSMARYPLYGALTIWILFTVLFVAAAIARRDTQDIGSLLVLPVLAGIFALVYGSIGLGVAILGGYTRLKWEEFRDERLSRQELLERYFELESRLRRGRPIRETPSRWRRMRLLQWITKHPGFAAIILGAFWTTTLVTFERTTGGPVDANLAVTMADAIKVLGGSVFQLGAALSLFAIGYLSLGVRLSLANGALYAFGEIAMQALLRIPEITTAPWPARIGHGVNILLFGLLFAVFGGTGYRVQEKSRRSARLRRNDQAMIVAEMLRIQWRLEDQSHDPCVMSIDAARSVQMKANADPLAVEFSFREYQEWIESIANQFSGAVHSRAGDGTIVSFPTCPSGYEAARRIQTDIGRFNAEVNRLEAPFRVRIGLHTGTVSGELDEVEYADVIDIAAHVQSVAPVGGIALTEAVCAKIPDEQFIPLATEIDGRRVFLALNPTED